MPERKLATIQKIKDLQPIEGADKIELATVNGWKVVVAKDSKYEIGEVVVYCEIDSFLPIKPEFEFLRKTSFKKMGDREGFCLKTIRMRGQISQGLIIPITAIKDFDPNTHEIGQDVSEELGIVKYEPPIPAQLQGKMKGNFPTFIPKTDEERVQNLDWEEILKHDYIVTEKLDGSSCTIYLHNDEFGVCSRNIELTETPDNTYWKVVRELKIEERMRAIGLENVALQGELIGEGIQRNQYKLKGQTIRFFTMFDIDSQDRKDYWTLHRCLREMNKHFPNVPALETVPCIYYVGDLTIPHIREELLMIAEDRSRLAVTEREGLVFRSVDDPKFSFKVISNKFLVK